MKRLRRQLPFFAVRPERSQSIQTTRTLATRQCRSSQCGERTGVKPLETKHSRDARHHEPTPSLQKRATQPGPSQAFP